MEPHPIWGAEFRVRSLSSAQTLAINEIPISQGFRQLDFVRHWIITPTVS
jgi:hypothetical protein